MVFPVVTRRVYPDDGVSHTNLPFSPIKYKSCLPNTSLKLENPFIFQTSLSHVLRDIGQDYSFYNTITHRTYIYITHTYSASLAHENHRGIYGGARARINLAKEPSLSISLLFPHYFNWSAAASLSLLTPLRRRGSFRAFPPWRPRGSALFCNADKPPSHCRYIYMYSSSSSHGSSLLHIPTIPALAIFALSLSLARALGRI